MLVCHSQPLIIILIKLKLYAIRFIHDKNEDFNTFLCHYQRTHHCVSPKYHACIIRNECDVVIMCSHKTHTNTQPNVHLIINPN